MQFTLLLSLTPMPAVILEVNLSCPLFPLVLTGDWSMIFVLWMPFLTSTMGIIQWTLSMLFPSAVMLAVWSQHSNVMACTWLD